MQRSKRRIICASLVLVYLCIFMLRNDESEENRVRPAGRIVWISLGICWSYNTVIGGRDAFPYEESAKMAAELWLKDDQEDIRILLTIVYTEQEISRALSRYIAALESLGVIVRLVPVGRHGSGGDVSCVLEAQLRRMTVAFEDKDVLDDDVVMVSDADIFVTDPSTILEPIRDKSQAHIQFWLFEYQETLDKGASLKLGLTAGTAEAWKGSLEFDGDIRKVIVYYDSIIGYRDDIWGIDRLIFSHAILKSGICTLPKQNRLWEKVKVHPRTETRNGSACWYGTRKYSDCNEKSWLSDFFGLPHECQWWHFTPEDGPMEVTKKYHHILETKKKLMS